MKILVIGSGNKHDKLSPIVENQVRSLRQKGVKVDEFIIRGRGIAGYLKHRKPLKEQFSENDYDLAHAHYSFSALLAGLTGIRPLVASLMGASEGARWWIKVLIRFFAQRRWDLTIVKSRVMISELGLRKALILPNGVDLNRFKPLDQRHCQLELEWDPEKFHILFAANPARGVKNFHLAWEAFSSIEEPGLMLHTIGDVKPENMPVWINACDLVVISSHSEGSPNVIKEAMACNKPVVSTDVGDVRWLFGNLEGYYLAPDNIEKYAGVLRQGIEFARTKGATNGRAQIMTLELDADNISQQIIDVYTGILNGPEKASENDE